MEDFKDAEARKASKKVNPFAKANILSKIFFTWMLPLFVKGFKRDLVEEDIYPHLASHESTSLGTRLETLWIKELETKPDSPSLWKCIGRVFLKDLVILGFFFMFVELFVRLAQPLCLAKLLEYYQPDSTMERSEAYYYAGAIALCSFVSQGFQHSFMMHNIHLGMKVRVATTALIYRKALKLNKSALAETTVGQMVNLMSNDVGRFEQAAIYIHHLWMAPLQSAVVLVLIYFYIGFTGMLGVLVFFAFIPVQVWMSKKTSEFRLATAIRTDERIRLMNEIISGIQVIKMYTWEKPFAKLVEFTRRREIAQIKKISVIRGIMLSLNHFMSRSAIYFCILAYILTGHVLGAQYVYLLQSFYEVLKMSVTNYFPQAVTQIAEANISVKRIKKFMQYEEVQSFNQSKDDSKPVEISISKASFKWLKSSTENNLENINFEAGPGELTAVIGPVGSGKTTLLHAILGELAPLSGSVNVVGRISYASQEPWLFVGSIRQNITFGQKFDAMRYHEVVRVCQLQRDFKLFPYGDQTIVGERGVSLSGGQRARINLARAVYKEADIYLLDDPLSAVDAYVGKQMFEKCITGYLKTKCVVLVTHQLQYLRDVKKIYLFGHGRVDHTGTYEQIQSAGTEFAQLLHHLKDIIDEDGKAQGDEADVQPVKTTRRISTKEAIPKEKVMEEPKLEKERRQGGSISWATYKSYFISGGHWCKFLALFLIFILSQALASIIDYFLTLWVNVSQVRSSSASGTSSASVGLGAFLTSFDDDALLIFYSVVMFGLIALTIGRSLGFYRFCNKASINLHNNMFYKIVYAAMRFFNVNPSGRILNRFSKDMNQVDELLPVTLLDTMQISLTVVSITAVVASVNPWMLLPSITMLTIFYFLRVIFLATSRDIKRLEGTLRSPVYSHLTASLQGLTTIRAFGAQQVLKDEFDNYQNAYSSAFFMIIGSNRTFAFWLDMHCVIFITLVTLSFLWIGRETMGGNVGLAITQSITLTGMFQWGIRQWGEMENTMTCVERIKEYADIVPEQDLVTKEPPKEWPERGNLVFDKLSMRYAQGEPCVLKELSFTVRSTEKVGIVGRTGAGKSSIIMALFRLALNEGQILLDDLDISKIPLRRLRSSISIIPQEPVLFSGTLRKNLDPFDEYTDEVLWRGLEEVELKSAVSELEHGLESRMSEGGSNFSVGQRQLVCLARAIVRKNKILVLDEATANVDPHTDALIQSTIRKKFSHCTVLTIAHRLHTIMDSDKVLVMDAGRVVEFGHPHELLQRKEEGVFYELVQQTGKIMADNLINIAEANYRDKKEL